jgi:hypothetical protein
VNVPRACCALTIAISCGALHAQTYDVAPELWDRPRTGNAVLAQESVKRAVAALIEKPDARAVIHHPAAQEPELQAEELRTWLAALAVDSRRIALRGDLAAGTPIRIEVIQ